MTVDNHNTQAPVVHDLPDAARYVAPLSLPWVLELHELLALTGNLRDAGYDCGDVIAKVDAVTSAFDANLAPDTRRYLTDDLLDLDPSAVVDRVRQAGLDLAAQGDIARVRQEFDRKMARDAAASLRQQSDRIVAEMRKQFDPAVTVVQAAAAAGLTTTTDTGQLLEVGSPDAIAAYRDLGPAVQLLDQVANLRTQMATIANIGPNDEPVALFLAAAPVDMEAAANLYRGEVEVVQYDAGDFSGSTLTRRYKPRLGGRWLALVAAGHKLRLNTATQADAVVQG